MTPKWRGWVAFNYSAKDGTPCGFTGMAYSCQSQEDGWQKAIEWLRNYTPRNGFLVRSFDIKVRFY